jgi:hypothetical protein
MARATSETEVTLVRPNWFRSLTKQDERGDGSQVLI